MAHTVYALPSKVRYSLPTSLKDYTPYKLTEAQAKQTEKYGRKIIELYHMYGKGMQYIVSKRTEGPPEDFNPNTHRIYLAKQPKYITETISLLQAYGAEIVLSTELDFGATGTVGAYNYAELQALCADSETTVGAYVAALYNNVSPIQITGRTYVVWSIAL